MIDAVALSPVGGQARRFNVLHEETVCGKCLRYRTSGCLMSNLWLPYEQPLSATVRGRWKMEIEEWTVDGELLMATQMEELVFQRKYLVRLWSWQGSRQRGESRPVKGRFDEEQ